MPRSGKKVRLAIDFSNAQALADWFEAAKAGGHFPDSAGVFIMDGLDRMSDSGVASGR